MNVRCPVVLTFAWPQSSGSVYRAPISHSRKRENSSGDPMMKGSVAHAAASVVDISWENSSGEKADAAA